MAPFVRGIAYAMTLALMIGACGGQEPEAEFPTGSFRTGIGNVITFNEDGTYSVRVTRMLGGGTFTGTFRLDGDEITFERNPACPVEGTYTWHYDAEAEMLEFSIIDDPDCAGRTTDYSRPLPRYDSDG